MKRYDEESFLAISGIQHYSFCPRQWALIHLEQQWDENQLTAEGRLIHERAHDPAKDEKRGELLITRGMPVFSAELGMRGVCDVVEFRLDEAGVSLTGREGKWLPVPIEYKHGNGRSLGADSLQLCCQGLCLESMLCCTIERGFLYYAEIRRREPVDFTDELRDTVARCADKMHALWERGYTPRVKPRPGCKSCSMKDVCLPQLERTISASGYVARTLRAETEDAP